VEALAGGKLRLDAPAPHVARLTLANPAKRNALDHDILGALAAILPELEARCLLLTGEGKAFSAGYDLGALRRGADADPFAAAIAALDDYPFPVVAALNGHAIGGGLELALSCDLRICSAAARLAMPPARLGLVYSHTGLRKFLDAVGAPRTRELFFSARTLEAREALAWGLVGEVLPPERVAARGVAVAAEIAANAPLALRGTKRIIRLLLEGADAAADAAALRAASLRSEDFREGVAAVAEKRSPHWHGR
jgi:enoyl-CoA hydratase/carnithine racemase